MGVGVGVVDDQGKDKQSHEVRVETGVGREKDCWKIQWNVHSLMHFLLVSNVSATFDR